MDNTPKINTNLKIWLVIMTIISCLLALISLPMIFFSPMAFDAPGSTSDFGLKLTVLGLFSIPILSLIGIIGSWRNAKRNPELSFKLSLLPILGFLLVYISFF